MNMKKVIIMSAVAIAMTSCVSKKKYAELSNLYNQSQIELAQCNTTSKSLDERLSEAKATISGQNKALAAMQQSLNNSINSGSANISKLVDEINASNKYIKQLTDAKSKSDARRV